jgi:hypothetical protein
MVQEMAKRAAFSLENHTVGEKPPFEMPIPLGQTKYEVYASREAWPITGGNVIQVTAEISFDGGENWEHLVGFTADGVDRIDPNSGLMGTESGATVTLPEPDNPNRRIRTKMNVLTPLKTAVNVETK